MPDELSKKAVAVAQIHRKMVGAFSDERNAEAEVLGRIVEHVLPALEALCSRFVMRQYGAKLGKDPVWFPERGVCVAGSIGTELALILLESGKWMKLKFDCRSGAPGEEVVEYSGRILEPEDVVRFFSASDVLRNIERILTRHIEGKASDRTEESMSRAQKLRAVLELLK